MYRHRENGQIVEDSVYVSDAAGQLQTISRSEALDRARASASDLICAFPEPPRSPATRPVCLLVPDDRPRRWEELTTPSSDFDPAFDVDVWFETNHCAGRHYLLGNPHTFRGRMSAWCPAKKVSFAISRSEIQVCSRETTYFLRGYLAGQEPDPPIDDDGDALPPDDPDQQAWAAAVDLFRATGVWNERYRICATCQARLLPSNPATTCLRHDLRQP